MTLLKMHTYVYMYIYASVMIADKAKVFKALGDDTRLTIIGFLLKNERCACEFADANKDQTTISRHLKVLSEVGIVKSKRKGRNLIYSIRDAETRDQLITWGIEEKDQCCEAPRLSGKEIKQIVKKKYGEIAVDGGSCSCSSKCCGDDVQTPMQISSTLGYSKKELNSVPESNLGLGCGNPGALGSMKKGETVLDLGSGAGMDAFLAANRVGKSGKVIGVDFTEEMVMKARKNAKANGFTNVEFRHGDIEDLPVSDESIDIVMSNCVINLVPDKSRAFKESYRVLKAGGRMYLSDMVLLDMLTEEQKADEDLISGCVGGAILKDDYLAHITAAGFQIKNVIEDKGIGKRQYEGLPVESLKVVAEKTVTKKNSRGMMSAPR
jgi:arsenite methyltransferase